MTRTLATGHRSRDLPATSHQLTIEAPRLEVVDGEDHLILVTPTCPDYWHGNCVVPDAPPADPVAWFARISASPLAARRRQLVRWETATPPPAALPGLPPEVAVEVDAVMRLAGPVLAAAEPPAGLVFRPASDDRDWAALVGFLLSGATYGSSAYREFFLYQYREHRAAFERTGSTWWTAWDGATLVGSLGLYQHPAWCRFRDVETRASHRRRGIAGALIATAVADARRSDADRPVYMVARAGEDPERLYLKLGFRGVGSMVTLMRDRP